MRSKDISKATNYFGEPTCGLWRPRPRPPKFYACACVSKHAVATWRFESRAAVSVDGTAVRVPLRLVKTTGTALWAALCEARGYERMRAEAGHRKIKEEIGFNSRRLEPWMYTFRGHGYMETEAAPAGIAVRGYFYSPTSTSQVSNPSGSDTTPETTPTQKQDPIHGLPSSLSANRTSTSKCAYSSSTCCVPSAKRPYGARLAVETARRYTAHEFTLEIA